MCLSSDLLSVISSIYDPLGFLSPFTLLAKLILQDHCTSKCGCNEEIPLAAVEKKKEEEWPKMSLVPMSLSLDNMEVKHQCVQYCH